MFIHQRVRNPRNSSPSPPSLYLTLGIALFAVSFHVYQPCKTLQLHQLKLYGSIIPFYDTTFDPSDPVHDILPADWDWNKCPCSLTHAYFISFSFATKPQPGKGLNTNCTSFLGYPRGRLPLFIIVNLLAGDINLNPGPDATYYPKPRHGSKPKWPCGLCNLAVKSNCIQCNYCDSWFHNKCSAASNDTLAYHFEHLSAVWICPACEVVNLTDPTFFVSDAPSLI